MSELQFEYQSMKQVVTPAYFEHSKRILIGSFLVLTVGLALIPWQQTAKGGGRVVAFSPTDRIQSVDAPVDGRLGVWHVEEGSLVAEGDPIVSISDVDPEILSRLQYETRAVESRIQAAKLSILNAKSNLDRQESLLKQGISSTLQVERARIEVARFESELASAQAEFQRTQVRVSRQKSQFITSPRSGTILRRRLGEGSQLVKAGEEVAVIVPDTQSRSVELWVSGNDVPLIEVGRKVRVQFEGWPAIQFSGWPSVAVGTFGGVVSVVDASDDGKGRFRILVTPDPQEPSWPSARYLRQGARASGWVILNQVKLGYELWRQFNGFPPTVPENSEQQKSSAKKTE